MFLVKGRLLGVLVSLLVAALGAAQGCGDLHLGWMASTSSAQAAER